MAYLATTYIRTDKLQETPGRLRFLLVLLLLHYLPMHDHAITATSFQLAPSSLAKTNSYSLPISVLIIVGFHSFFLSYFVESQTNEPVDVSRFLRVLAAVSGPLPISPPPTVLVGVAILVLEVKLMQFQRLRE
jgi:hypothetical protein